jgi:hypothetical protein
MSVPVSLQFADNGSVVAAEFECIGEPSPLKSGKIGWFAVSEEMDWCSGWRLRMQCSITKTLENYGYPKPRPGTTAYTFDPDYCGNLAIEDRKIAIRLQIPDCFDPPTRKSFNWGQPILLDERMYHCALRLELRSRKIEGHLRRKHATPERVGGVEFLSSGPNGDVVIGFIPDSDGRRGRVERVDAILTQRNSEYVVGAPYRNAQGRLLRRIDLVERIKVRQQACDWVDAHPSQLD